MQKIILKQLKLTNFKGIRSFECSFDENMTTIEGRNGLGKSTIFDAFTYLLFGKDSHGSTSFNIKTIDSDGNIIPKIPHEVLGIISVDGTEVTLRRCYTEKWTKHKGSATEVLTGNTEEYFINDVPYKKSEYQEYISDICDEQLFKLITSPTYFTSLPWKEQRTILFDMAGNISDEELAKGNEDFVKLLHQLTGKDLEGYKKEVFAKEKSLKAEIEKIPSRIDECKRNMPEADDWKFLEEQIANGKKRISEINESLTNIASLQDNIAEERKKLLNRQSEIYSKRMELERTIKAQIQQGYFEKAKERQQLTSKIYELEDEVKQTTRRRDELVAAGVACRQKREELVAEYRNIVTSELVLPEDSFVCPTCKRPLEAEDIEETRRRLTEEFNENKAKALEENQSKGFANKKAYDSLAPQIQALEDDIAALNEKIKSLKADPAFTTDTEIPSSTLEIESNAKWKDLLRQEEELQAEIDKPLASDKEQTTKDSLRNEREGLEEHIEQLTKILARKEQIETLNARIAELEKQLQNQAQALADLEKIEFTIQEFTMARINALTEKVNSMFTMVNFKLYKDQLNGGRAEVCEATINGVPFSDANTAAKILAGLDIISSVGAHYNTYAPVVIDNSECINKLPDNPYQTIALKVSDTNKLVVS